MNNVLKCKEVADRLNNEIKEKSTLLRAVGIIPTIAIVRVGERADDIFYEKSVINACIKTNIDIRTISLPSNVTMKELEKKIVETNNDDNIDGILIFRPLPEHIDEELVKNIISPAKDIDCMNPHNLSRIFEGVREGFAPCTPAAIIEILNHFKIDVQGKNVVVIGRSMVVGKPLAMLLLGKNATVTICHSKTENLSQISNKADIVIVAIGKAKAIKVDMIKPGAVVIDVGINADENGKMCGDVDFDSVSHIAERITPVPGGVGSVTTAVLLKQLVEAAKKSRANS